MFIWYAILKEDNQILAAYLNWLPKEYTPLVAWLYLIIYLFFLFKVKWFNYSGRRYFYSLLKKCLFSPFVAMEFRIAWLTDQLISLSGALKDFEYTICYYYSNWSSSELDVCNYN